MHLNELLRNARRHVGGVRTQRLERRGIPHPDHPVQRQIRTAIEQASGEPCPRVAVDGCGAPVSPTIVRGFAEAAHGLVGADSGTAHRAVADAMPSCPIYSGGSGHPNSKLMRRMPGAVGKGGAEGVILAAAAASGQTVAMKIIDDSPGAATILAQAALASIGVDTSEAGDLARVDILGGGRPVGAIHLGDDVRAALGPAA